MGLCSVMQEFVGMRAAFTRFPVLPIFLIFMVLWIAGLIFGWDAP